MLAFLVSNYQTQIQLQHTPVYLAHISSKMSTNELYKLSNGR